MTTTLDLTDLKLATITDLVLAAQNGCRAAFGELFERFERCVFSIGLRRLGDFSEAQELCQDVFIQAMEKIDQLRDPLCFAGWLRSIANRMAINRAVRRPPDMATEPDTLAATCVEEQTPMTLAIEGERRSHVRAGLQRLHDLDRRTLEAFYLDGQSLLEMADEFDAPLGTIKRRLHVARKRLAKQVETLVAV